MKKYFFVVILSFFSSIVYSANVTTVSQNRLDLMLKKQQLIKDLQTIVIELTKQGVSHSDIFQAITAVIGVDDKELLQKNDKESGSFVPIIVGILIVAAVWGGYYLYKEKRRKRTLDQKLDEAARQFEQWVDNL